MAIVDNAFREWIADFKAANPGAADSRAILDTAQYAFAAGRKAQREIDAARQPVGEPVAWMDPDGSRVLTAKAKANASGAYKSATSGYTVPLYPPAQAVDLGAVREAVRKAWQKCAAGESVDLQFGTLLALIDSQAVGNG